MSEYRFVLSVFAENTVIVTRLIWFIVTVTSCYTNTVKIGV